MKLCNLLNFVAVTITIEKSLGYLNKRCEGDIDCSLNGKCDTTTGDCHCYSPWTNGKVGSRQCNVLQVLPQDNNYIPAYGGPRKSTAWQKQEVTSWGGNMIKDEQGQFHLYVSRMHNGWEGLSTWQRSSQVDHAVANDPLDTFEFSDVALTVEAHNPSPIRAHNGSYLLFHIGAGSGLSHSKSLYGPWNPLPFTYCNNPAPVLHPNGTYFCACSQLGTFSIIRSDDVFANHSTWVHVTDLTFPLAWVTPTDYMRCEDPYIWIDSRGNWHLLSHNYDYRDGYVCSFCNDLITMHF